MTRKKRSLTSFSASDSVKAANAPDEGADAADELIDAGSDSDLDIAPPETGRSLERAEGGGLSLAARRRQDFAKAPLKGGRGAYVAAAVLSLLWAALMGAFFSGYVYGVEPFNLAPVALVLIGVVGAGMVATFWTLAYVASQGSRMAVEARIARAQAEDLVQPAALAGQETRHVVELVRIDIENAVGAANQARHELITLREALALETARLVEAAASSARTAADLTRAMGDERAALLALSEKLEGQVLATEEAITRQARMVAEASDLAETQLREAEAALLARTGDLAAASGEAAETAKVAGEDLSRQAGRLEAAGAVVGEQVRIVEESLAEQRAAIVTVAHALRAEQEDFATQIEAQQAGLAEVLNQLRAGAGELTDNTRESGQSLRDLVASAIEQVRQAAQAISEERDLLGAESLKSIGAVSEAARHERESLAAEVEQAIREMAQGAAGARLAAAEQTEAARTKIDELSQAAFAAGQQADSAFEARLNEARALIEQSASLVEEAGRRAGERLVEGLANANTTIAELEGLLQRIEDRTQVLPAQAEARAAEVKAAVEEGVETLLVSARKAAEETQAIDAAFQERVRRNYEMLSEAVRLMGVVGGGAPPRPARATRDIEAQPTPDDAPRSRLKLTPEGESAEAPDSIFELEVPPPPKPKDDGWTWSEILSSVEDESPRAATQAHGAVIAEISALGIDMAALLPQSRLDEIATVLQAGDRPGARAVVRRLAPVALRRLSRSLITNPALREGAQAFKGRVEGLLDEAARQDHSGATIAALLAGEDGRAYLLVDAALGETA